MPISPAARPGHCSLLQHPSNTRTRIPLIARVVGVACLALAVPAPAQTLAHPNWVGNGMSTDPWWQHAVVYRVQGTSEPGAAPSGAPDYKFLAARINAIRSVGIDALLIAAPPVPGQDSTAEAQSSAAPAATAQKEVDQLDDLIRVASSRGVRVLLTLNPASASADLSGIARFWLSRGIAGFHVTTPPGAGPGETVAMIQALRRLTAGAVGQRIVISDLDLAGPDPAIPTQPPPPTARRSGSSRAARTSDVAPQLEVDDRPGQAQWSAASLRAALAQSAAQPNLLVDLKKEGTAPSTAEGHSSGSLLMAALSLLTHPAAIIDSDANLVFDPAPEHVADDSDLAPRPAPAVPAPGVYLPYKPYVPPSKNRTVTNEPAPKDPLTAWYRQVAALHHTHPAFRAGNLTFLDFDAQNALVWVARSGTGAGAPGVVVCNLSGSPVQVSLRRALEQIGLHGSYLRTLLRSDTAVPPQDPASITVPAHGVYVGELRR